MAKKQRGLKERGLVYDAIIDEIAMETELPVTAILEYLAKEEDIKVSEIKDCLRAARSKFVANNNLLGYINGKPYKRTAVAVASTHIMHKVHDRLVATMPDFEYSNENAEIIGEAVREFVEDGLMGESHAEC